MKDRAYTVHEIDALRLTVESKWLFGSYTPSNTQFSRHYREAEKTQCVEELVRTYMLAGLTAEDLIASENSSSTVTEHRPSRSDP